jgi:hypothetical protein
MELRGVKVEYANDLDGRAGVASSCSILPELTQNGGPIHVHSYLVLASGSLHCSPLPIMSFALIDLILLEKSL